MFFLIYTAVFVLFANTLSFTFPFILGIVFGFITLPVCRFLENKLHMRRRLAAILTAVVSYILFLLLLLLLVYWLIYELVMLFSDGSIINYDELSPAVRRAMDSFFSALPQITDRMTQLISDNLSSLLPVMNMAFRSVFFIPALFLIFALIPIASFLFLSHRDTFPRICDAGVGHAKTVQLQEAVHALSHTSGGFASAYFLIYFITFCEAFIILFLLKIKYPVISALIVTVSDIFPILGPGTVLLPIGLYQLLCGRTLTAVGVFIGWIILTVIRQIIEPRLVSKVTRTPPFIMVTAVYFSFISGNFWIILYAGAFFFILQILKNAKWIQKNDPDSMRKSGS